VTDAGADTESLRGKRVVAAIDFRHTVIYATDAASGERPSRLVADDPKGYYHKVSHRAGNPGGTYEPDSQEYWREISDALAPAAALLLLGHGQGRANASHHFVAYVEEHRPEVAAKIVADVRVDIDALTEEQVFRLAQVHFGEQPVEDLGDGRWGEPSAQHGADG
jgi:hypothetical protein